MYGVGWGNDRIAEQREADHKRQGGHGSAGVLYNRGMALLEAHEPERAKSEFMGVLNLCSNHRPAFEGLAACCQETNDHAALEDLVAQWGAIPPEADAASTPPQEAAPEVYA